MGLIASAPRGGLFLQDRPNSGTSEALSPHPINWFSPFFRNRYFRLVRFMVIIAFDLNCPKQGERIMKTENVLDADAAASFPISNVNRVKRVHERGRYDKKTIYEILDSALVCHIAYVIDGRPYCTPTAFWREGDHLYWHGSSASRMIRTQADPTVE